MAFAYAVTERSVFGNKRIVYGTWTNGSGDTGGDIVTGLAEVQGCILQAKGSAVTTGREVVNETFPLINSTGAVTIVSDDNADGSFIAWGK